MQFIARLLIHKRVCLAALLLCVVAIARASAADEQQIAPLYKRAIAGDKAATEQCIALLERAVEQQPKNEVARVYLGSAYALRSRDMTLGLAKLNTFRRGMALMDEAVAAAPENVRVRLVRALTCEPLPGFLGRRQIARDDFGWLAKEAARERAKFTADELATIRQHTH